jgi:antibiotic biosynthesis monooxygenase (ABM) superfamily enzyme
MIYPFLNRLKIPFFVITFILIAMDMTLSLLGFYLEFSTSTPTSIIYLIISVALLAFYVVTLVKVMGRMRISKEVRGESKKFRRLSDVRRVSRPIG